MDKINDLLIKFMYKLCIWRRSRDSDSEALETIGDVPTQGFNGVLDVESALLFENNNAVLSVDYDFLDMPSWVEGNLETGALSVVQMGGDVATLKVELPKNAKENWQNLQQIILVTRFNTEKLMHHLSFVLQK